MKEGPVCPLCLWMRQRSVGCRRWCLDTSHPEWKRELFEEARGELLGEREEE